MLKLKRNINLILICIGATIVNLIGSTVAKNFHLPLYLDTGGTIFISALGGIAPGIIVGFMTNIFDAIIDNGRKMLSGETTAITAFDFTEVYFSSVSVILALFTAFLAQRGHYKNFTKAFMTIPATAFLTTAFALSINFFLSLTGDATITRNLELNFVEKFFVEICDKGAMILLAYGAIKHVPPDVSKKFHTLGQRQALTNSDMLRDICARNLSLSSLRTKMLLTLMALMFFTAAAISAVSYVLYKDSAVRERIKIADGITSMVVSSINPNRVDDYLTLGRAAEGYNDVERELYRIRASNSDIRFLYVYKIEEDGCHVVFDLDTADIEAFAPGEIQEFDESFYEYLPALLAGKPIPPIVNDDTYGYLLTVYKPVYNHNGQCVCYAAIDFSMDLISEYGRSFVIKIISLLAGSFAFIFILGLVFIENNIILPVNSMAWCAEKFSYKDVNSRQRNVALIKSLDIRTGDEIEHLYDSLTHSIEDSMTTFDDLRKTEVKVAVMNELAHTDSLTGIKNKTAYDELTARLDKQISDGTANFAVVMIDVNYLKKVNDTYGHERGNEYLINACNLACEIFGRDNVFRIGGDEFVAVLVGDDAGRYKALVRKINATVTTSRFNDALEPWEKVSAAVGSSLYRAGVDKTCDEVFKRADSQMYKNKLAMKALRTD